MSWFEMPLGNGALACTPTLPDTPSTARASMAGRIRRQVLVAQTLESAGAAHERTAMLLEPPPAPSPHQHPAAVSVHVLDGEVISRLADESGPETCGIPVSTQQHLDCPLYLADRPPIFT
jgi:hypothetical protein